MANLTELESIQQFAKSNGIEDRPFTYVIDEYLHAKDLAESYESEKTDD